MLKFPNKEKTPIRIKDDPFSFPSAYFNMVLIDILKLVQLLSKMDIENKQVKRSFKRQETKIKPSFMQLCTHYKYKVEVKIDRQLGQWKDNGMAIQDCYLSPNR